MKPLLETWLLLLVVIGGTILATASWWWGDEWPALLVRSLAPVPVGFAAGRILAHIVTLVGDKQRAEQRAEVKA